LTRCVGRHPVSFERTLWSDIILIDVFKLGRLGVSENSSVDKIMQFLEEIFVPAYALFGTRCRTVIMVSEYCSEWA
jgi:hypothetical protein